MESIEKPRSIKERGFMTVMFLMILGLFLTFVAFGVDVGNYYLWQLRFDKAARAGVLAGLGRRGLDGWTSTSAQNGSNVIAAVKDVIEGNLKSSGLTLTSATTITTTYSATTDTVEVTIDHPLKMVLVDKLRNIFAYGFNFAAGSPPAVRIKTRQVAQLSISNIVLLLDVSGSMLCPSASGDTCTCRLNNSCAVNNSKLSLMATGASNFVTMFNPNRDRLSVIPFNLAAQRLYSFVAGRPTAQLSASQIPTISSAQSNNTAVYNGVLQSLFANSTTLQNTLSNITGSNTNHCDALAEAILELDNLSTALYGQTGQGSARQQLKPFVVLFTDGAPNAMRGVFPTIMNPGDPQANLKCRTYLGDTNYSPSSSATNCTTQDMYHYALEWVHSPAQGTQAQYRGPGPFVVRQYQNGSTKSDFTLATTAVPTLFQYAISSAFVAPLNSQTCGEHDSNPTVFEQTITKNSNGGAGQRGNANRGCFITAGSNFKFSIPYTDLSPNETTATGSYRGVVSGVPISTANTIWQDKNWPSSFFTNNTVAYGVQKYDELPYYCALEAADYLRLQFGATIFTIGLGPTAVHDRTNYANGANCNDPLQDADDHNGRKDFFLARLSFSRQMFLDQYLPTSIPPHYLIKGAQNTTRRVSSCQRGTDLNTVLHRFASGVGTPPTLSLGYTSEVSTLIDGSTTYRDLRPQLPTWADSQYATTGDVLRRIDTQGEYFPTNDPNEVPSIFNAIAKSILLRSAS